MPFKRKKRQTKRVKKVEKRRILSEEQVRHLSQKYKLAVLTEFAKRMLSFSRRHKKETTRLGLETRLGLRGLVDATRMAVVDTLAIKLLEVYEKSKKYSKSELDTLRKEIKEILRTATSHRNALNLIAALAEEFPHAKPKDIANFAWLHRNTAPEKVVAFFREIHEGKKPKKRKKA